MLGDSPRAVATLIVVALVGLTGLGAWLWLESASQSEPMQEVSDEEAYRQVIERTLARTLQESKTGVEAPVMEAAPGTLPASPPAGQTVPMPPDGYQLVSHEGPMRRAPMTSKARPEPTPSPDWLDPAISFNALKSQAERAGREWTFAAVRIAPGTDLAALGQTLSRLGARIEGFSGEYARVSTPVTEHSLSGIAGLPEVLGLGALPSEVKVAPGFFEESLSKPASELVPVYVTLMADDTSGEWRDALTDLGLVVGAYDAALRSYTANLPYSLVSELAAADFVMGIEPVGVVRALHDTAVPFMGADAMRTYQYATGSFTGVTGQGIPVAVMDTGLNIRHIDISSGRSSLCGASFVAGQHFDLWTDLYGHGTHVTGTIAGKGMDEARFAGMAPNVSDIRFAKVLDFRGFGSDLEVRRAMDYLSRPSGCILAGPMSGEVKPLIVNMSLSMPGISFSGRGFEERKLDSIVHTNSQLYVVAQANAADQGFSNYGTAKNSLAVGAVDDAGQIAPFSSRGPTADNRLAPNLVASGVDVASAAGSARRTGYQTLSGTSMASPSVAGVAALLMEAETDFQNQPALTRARLMASAVRPDAFLKGPNEFPRNNTNGPGTLQNAYGLGLASTRTSVLSRDEAEGWVTGSATASPVDGTYEYVDIVVPTGTSRLDLVMTWDEQPADTLTNSVLNDLDLWVDQGADCTVDACGEFSSLSSVDNVEWLFISDPKPGTYRVKVLPTRLYGESANAAIAWTAIRGDSTPLLNLHLDQESITLSDGEEIEIDATVSTSHYVASGTTLHLSCRGATNASCPSFEFALDPQSSQVVREDGIVRPLSDWTGIATPISLGEIGVGDERRLRLKFSPRGYDSDTRLFLTATAWNARSASAYLDVVPNESSSESTFTGTSPINDHFEDASAISGSSGSSDFDLLPASREPGEPSVGPDSRSVWYSWTAPSEGLYRLRLSEADSGDAYESQINIYTGEEIVSLKRYAKKFASEVTFATEYGVTYRLQIVSTDWDANPLVLEWEPADLRPANDDFSFAEQVTVAQAEVSGTNEGATLERGEYWGGLAATVWYSWTAPQDGFWQFLVDSPQLRLAVFHGANLSSLRLVSSADPYDAAAIPVKQNQVYRIAVAAAGADASGAQYTLSWSELPEAEFNRTSANDQFTQASTIEGSEGGESTPAMFEFTVQPGEPAETGAATGWWQWSAPETASYTWRIGGSDAYRLTLFTGADVDSLSLVASATGGSALVMDATAGTTYRIALGRSQDTINHGAYDQPDTIIWGTTPSNDDRADATQITGTGGSTSLDLGYATAEIGEPTDSVGYESLWWRWSAPSSGWYRFWIAEDPLSLILSVYPNGQDLDPVAASDRMFAVNGRVEVWVHASSGDQYNIRVSRRPLVEAQDMAMLHWETANAPALLGYKHAVTNESLDSSPSGGGLSNPRNLVSNGDGSRLFSTSDHRLLGFERDSTTGALSLAQRVDSDSTQETSVDFSSLSSAKLRWDATNDRLLAHAESAIYDFELSEDESSLDYSSTLSISGGTTSGTPRRVVTNSDGSLIFALHENPDLVRVFRVNSTDADALTLIQTVKTADASGVDELLAADIESPRDLVVASDDSHLYLAASNALVVFAIDSTTSKLSQVRTISAADTLSPEAFLDIQGLSGLELDSTGRYLFATGSSAPQAAVFDVSADASLPVFLDSVTDFHFSNSSDFLAFTPFHSYPGFFGECWYAERHGSLPAIDVICADGFYTAWWDASAGELAVIDYANSGSFDRFGTEVPRFTIGARQLAQSPNGAHLYLATGNARQEVSDPHSIHVFERASGRTLDESGNHAPTINKALTDQIARVGTALRYQFAANTFSDADMDTLTFSASGMPSWVAFNATTRIFSGTPESEHITQAPIIITVTASDPSSASISAIFALHVQQAAASQNAPPLVSRTIPNQTAVADEAFSFVFAEGTFRDPDGDSLTFAASGLPDWLSFDALTRTFSGTPAESDLTENPIAITVTASDGNEGSARTSFYLSVRLSAIAAARISISSSATELKEWGDDSPVTVTLEIDSPVNVDQVVSLSATGTAELGKDFELESAEVTISAGSMRATSLLNPILDFDSEGEETITLAAASVSGGVAIGETSSVSLALGDLGALFPSAKTTLYGDLNLFFSDRIIEDDEIEFQALIYNLGVKRTSPTTLRFWTSSTPDYLTPVGSQGRVSLPGIDPGSGLRATLTVDLDDYSSAGTYYTIAGVLATDEELAGRAYTNEDLTGFTLDSDLEVVTTCPDLTRNSSPGTTDPLVDAQWNLGNTGQTAYAIQGGVAGEDLDMSGALADGPTGSGIKIAIVDTGLEICHPDLEGNVETSASYNFNSSDWHGSSATDPYFSNSLGDHGTSVAGIIAAVANNGIGGRGVAASASIRGYNYLEANADSGPFLDSLGGSSANPNSTDVDIFNMSFGSIGGEFNTSADQVALYKKGVTSLRGRKGAIYVKAGGNGFGRCASMRRRDETSGFDINREIGCVASNADPSTNLPYLVPIGAFNADGVRASYSSAGSSLWVTAPSGEFGNTKPAMITTDQMGSERGYDRLVFDVLDRTQGLMPGAVGNPHGDYVSTFNGTSASAPNASGAIALLLDEYPDLTWRDVKYILARTARKIDPDIPEFKVAFGGEPAVLRHAWTTNAAGYSFHNWYGFGAISVDDALALAATHTANSLGSFVDGRVFNKAQAVNIPDHKGAGVSQVLSVSGLAETAKIEAVSVTIRATHPFTNDLGVYLISPSGTQSILHPVFSETLVADANLDWNLLSNAFYGEAPNGDWTIKVIDAATGDTGTLDSWNLTFWLGEIPEKE